MDDYINRMLIEQHMAKDEADKLRERFHEEMEKGTPRYRRAQRFTSQIMWLMRDFIPEDRECRQRVEEHVMLSAFASNAEVVSVPPELDALNALELERRMLETAMAPIKASMPTPTEQPPAPPKR